MKKKKMKKKKKNKNKKRTQKRDIYIGEKNSLFSMHI
jgi:hypothetical protein